MKRRDSLKKEGHSPDKARAQAIKELSQLIGTEGFGKTSMKRSYKQLVNKTASEVEIIRWVANNLENPNPSPNCCPSLTAWALLRECKKNKDFKSTFIFNIWTKLLPNNCHQKEQEDITENPTITFDLLNKIREIKEKASKANQQ